jgi:hypothetical protein
MSDIITNFDGKYWYLSNFTYSPFIKNDKKWDTVEHYFQAMKTTDLEKRETIRTCGHPRFAKRIGRSVKLRLNWESIKQIIIYTGVKEKFEQNIDFNDLLLKTDCAYLVEGNTWHDNIWGDCFCSKCKDIKGQNLLGIILMKVRKELRDTGE